MSELPRVVYLVSRFPKTSETFIVRELDGLDRLGVAEVRLRSLFPSPDRAVHDIARRWVPRLVRPGVAQAAHGLLWALRHRFRATCVVLATVLGAHLRKPGLAIRALYTVALASSHARDLAREPDDLVRTRVHAHYATYPALAAWVCHRLVGVPYSFTAHAHDLYVDTSMLATKVADAEFVVTISEYNRALLEALQPEGRVPIHVIHCGIAVDRYPYRERQPAAEGPLRALCVASLQEYKGHRYLLEALAGPGPVSRIELELIGAGELEEELRRHAGELGVAERVHFRGGRSEIEVRDALDRVDLFVLPSVVAADGQMEGLPVALMEALACGVPAVSTRLSGIPEIVVDGETGLLAEPADPMSLRKAIEETLGGGAAIARRARAGRSLVEREFGSGITLARLAEVLARPARG